MQQAMCGVYSCTRGVPGWSSARMVDFGRTTEQFTMEPVLIAVSTFKPLMALN